MENNFFNRVSIELHRITRLAGAASGDMVVSEDLLERGRGFILSWLKDATLREHFADDAQLFYYNVAYIAFCGGVAYADAWDKDPAQIKMGVVDTLLASQRDIPALASDILGTDDAGRLELHGLLDDMFGAFLELMEPYWEADDPRHYLFQGLLAFFQTGISYRLS